MRRFNKIGEVKSETRSQTEEIFVERCKAVAQRFGWEFNHYYEGLSPHDGYVAFGNATLDGWNEHLTMNIEMVYALTSKDKINL